METYDAAGGKDIRAKTRSRRNLWQKMISIGIERAKPGDIRYIKATNAANGFVFVSSFLFGVFALAIGNRPSLVLLALVVTLGLALLLFWFNHRGLFDVVRIVFVIMILMGTISYSSFDQGVGVIVAIFGMAATFVIIPSRKWLMGALFSLTFLLLFSLTMLPQLNVYNSVRMLILRLIPFNEQQVTTTKVVFGLLIFFVIQYSAREMTRTETALDRARARADSLLSNVLPSEIAERLKEGESRIADRFDGVSILFADVVNFTEFASELTPDEVVAILDEMFREFDGIARRFGLEKIKTIGDAYMAAAGVPHPVTDHERAAVEMAMEMHNTMKNANGRFHGLQLRIGINSGSVIAGVIGEQKFLYDLWGDAVNTSSRMESHGIPGEIQVTKKVAEALREEFVFESRGEIEIKGKGMLPVYLVKSGR